jgi:hypothetical protein
MPSTAQPSPETDEKKSRGLGSYVVWAFVAVMVYVLSSGPAFLLTTTGGSFRAWRSPMCAKMFSCVYWPLIHAWEGHGPLHKSVGIYWHLWLPGMFDANGDRTWTRLP